VTLLTRLLEYQAALTPHTYCPSFDPRNKPRSVILKGDSSNSSKLK
jgi:hypothetical protein